VVALQIMKNACGLDGVDYLPPLINEYLAGMALAGIGCRADHPWCEISGCAARLRGKRMIWSM